MIIHQIQIIDFKTAPDNSMIEVKWCNIGEENLPSTSWFIVPEEYRYLVDRGLVGIYELLDLKRQGRLPAE